MITTGNNLVSRNMRTLKTLLYKANPKLIKETKTFQLVLDKLIKENLKIYLRCLHSTLKV